MRPHRRQPTRLPRPWDSPGKNTGVGCHILLQGMKEKSESEVAQSCLTLSDPTDYSPPGSSVHGFSRQEHWSGAPLLATGICSCRTRSYFVCVHTKLLQSCLTLCDLMDCSPPGLSVHGIFQARILEWVAMASSRGSS